MQISPKVYSSEAQRQKFQKSLLERLFRHHESYSRHLDSRHPLNVLLSQNYRSKMEILRFISAIFYGGPDRLQAKSVQPAVDGLVPLNFYVAQGQEHQDRESTSFYNASEIEEITARVEELYIKWPEEWGEPQPDSIGVVTPYYDQVIPTKPYSSYQYFIGATMIKSIVTQISRKGNKNTKLILNFFPGFEN